MRSSSQNPDMTPLSGFDNITAGLPVLTPWQALFNEAEEILRETHPDGFEVEDIGRAAFDSLPEGERDAALDELFYTFWAATLADRETRAMNDQGAS